MKATQQPEQIQLQEISVYNWGSFNGYHTGKIHSQGTLITGDNGAGKSTLVDALIALLLPAGRATFNTAAAQGDKSDRNLLSYIRGSYGHEHDGIGAKIKSLRDGATLTAIKAFYKSGKGEKVTLMALFWTNHASQSLADLQKVYLVSKNNLSLPGVLKKFDTLGPRKLKEDLRKNQSLQCLTEKFSLYQEAYMELFKMENHNAPLLLSKALGLKKIDDLTKLIRELVLEPSSLLPIAEEVIREFSDLKAIYHRLTDEKERQSHLSPLPQHQLDLQKSHEGLVKVSAQQKALPTYFAQFEYELSQNHAQRLKREREEIQARLKALYQEIDKANEEQEVAHARYIQQGGFKLEDLRVKITELEKKIPTIERKSRFYQQLCLSLELESQGGRASFDKNKKCLPKKRDELRQSLNTEREKRREVDLNIFEQEKSLKDLTEKLNFMKKRAGSNIPISYQQLRERCALHLGVLPESLPFIGEMIDVNLHSENLRGLVEKSLGEISCHLLVPEKDKENALKFFEKELNLDLKVHFIDPTRKFKHQTPIKGGICEKLVWKESEMTPWLVNFLASYDMKYLKSLSAILKVDCGILDSGLMQPYENYFIKNDLFALNDFEQWSLGFSNKKKQEWIIKRQKELEGALARLKRDKGKIDGNIEKGEKFLTNLAHLEQIVDWDELDIESLRQEQEKLKKNLALLERNKKNLDTLKQLWLESKRNIETLRQKVQDLSIKNKITGDKIQSLDEKMDSLKEYLSIQIEPEVLSDLQTQVGLLKEEDYRQLESLFKKTSQNLNAQFKKWTELEKCVSVQISQIISSFRAHEKWTTIAAEWGGDITNIDQYIEHLTYIEKDGLPPLIDKFESKINQSMTQSLVTIVLQVHDEHDKIRRKIDSINTVLKKAEFQTGSYLKIGSEIEKFPHVIRFESEVRQVTQSIEAPNYTERYHQFAHVITTLENAVLSVKNNTLEGLRLLDPRYQRKFFTEVINKKTGKVTERMDSSSGKSGGEKESFSGMIVAASLSYVLTPEGHDYPIYSTVFLDEAFSNTSEMVSQRVLKVFKSLKIHVNLVTPCKNLNLAREHTSSLLFIDKDQDEHSSHISEKTWKEIEKISVETT